MKLYSGLYDFNPIDYPPKIPRKVLVTNLPRLILRQISGL